MSLDELLKTKRDEILKVAAKYGASNVRVFGSVARGEEGPDSDIDLLVVMDFEGRKSDTAVKLRGALPAGIGPVDILVTTPADFANLVLGERLRLDRVGVGRRLPSETHASTEPRRLAGSICWVHRCAVSDDR